MTDIRIKENKNIAEPIWDWVIRADTQTLDEREQLATAVRVALGTDSLADVNERLPDPDSTDRRGWWGDMDAETVWDGWPIGVKNWLLTRAKITQAPSEEGSTLARARQYTLQALQPFIAKGVASRVEVEATRSELQRIDVRAIIYRGPLKEIDLSYQLLWDEGEAIDRRTILPENPENLQAGSPVLASPTLTQKQVLSSASLAVSAPVLDAGRRIHVLTGAAKATASPVLTAPTLQVITPVALTGASLATASPVLTSATLQIPISLSAASLASLPPSLTAVPDLTAF